MNQNTQYLYEYRNGERIRNVGFTKIEKQLDKQCIEIYGKQMDAVKGIVFENEKNECYIASWEPCELQTSLETSLEKEIEMEEFIPHSHMKCEKIQRQELSRLPRKEWRLANNSFLLHGFYNYHHLLYIEEEGAVWIGVPGTYHEKEKIAASAFGFTVFKRVQDVPVDLEDCEKNTYEDFGYWCRQVMIS